MVSKIRLRKVQKKCMCSPLKGFQKFPQGGEERVCKAFEYTFTFRMQLTFKAIGAKNDTICDDHSINPP